MVKSGAKSLKSALQAQQSRLKGKKKLEKSAQSAELGAKKNKVTKSKRKVSNKSSRTTVPFRPSDRILLIGEGNFSFARALIEDAPSELEYLPPKNITATAYDTEEECYLKYPEAEAIVNLIKERGVEVLFGIDATKLEKVVAFRGRTWDRVVWNFPHAGKGITDQDRNILTNQLLILGFLKSVESFLCPGPIPRIPTYGSKKWKAVDDEDDSENEGGEAVGPSEGYSRSRGTVLITLRSVLPYTQWEVTRLAKNPPPQSNQSPGPNVPYTLLRSFAFHREFWKGYDHRMTKGERAQGLGKTGEGGEDRTWEFYVKE